MSSTFRGCVAVALALATVAGATLTSAFLNGVNAQQDETSNTSVNIGFLEVLFSGIDAAGNRGLWITNGKSAGTHELTGIVGANANGILGGSVGFSPGFTQLNGEVVFSGLDAANNIGLWVTNGTAAGTHELTGINGAYSGGLFTGNFAGFTVLGGNVLFGGRNTAGYTSVWATDGTVAGTHELSGIGGAGFFGVLSGLNVDMVAFGDEALFEGLDAANNNGLWVTNGTAAGTYELTGISGAYTGSGGLFGRSATTGSAFPPDFTVFNSAVLFNGLGTAGNNGLWATDGTAAGTHELIGISGIAATGVDPHYLTAFNGEVLFEGTEADGTKGLWVTDGTAAGTHELTGISGANPGGLNPSYLTVFNNKVLFNGLNAAVKRGLWVTDGTAAGTHELTDISGADANGLDPSNFAVMNNEVLFLGASVPNGKPGLWMTNGTSHGTHELTDISGANTGGLSPSGLTVVTVLHAIKVPGGK